MAEDKDESMAARLLRREALRREAATLNADNYLTALERIERRIVAEVTAEALQRKNNENPKSV
jgi:hypothetical protein